MTTSTPAADSKSTEAQIATDIQTITGDMASAAETVSKANLWTAIIGFFTALPGLVQLALQFWAWADKISGGNPGTLIANFGSQIGALAAAETQEDRDAATQGIANLISRLPS